MTELFQKVSEATRITCVHYILYIYQRNLSQLTIKSIERMSNEAEANQVNPPTLSSKLDKKRKRHTEDSSSKPEANDNTGNGNNNTNDDTSAQPSKRKLKKAKKNKKHGLQEEQDVKDQEHKDEEHEDGIDESIGKMDSRLLADYIAQRTMRLNKALTAVELEDLNIPG